MGVGVLYIIYSLLPSPTLGHGRMTHFSEGLHGMAVGQISIYLLFVSLFFMVYTPPKYFILRDLKSVLYLIAWGWKKFKFLGGLLYCSSCTFLARGKDESCNLKNSWRQHYLFYVCMLIFFSFTWEFSVWVWNNLL